METKTEVEQTVPVTGKTVFGAEGLKNPTPKWATNVFRGFFIANKVLTFWFASTKLIPLSALPEIIIGLNAIDFGVWLTARFLGVKKSDIENETSN